MVIDGIYVDSFDDTDIHRVWQFEHDGTFHQVVLTEDGNNLRAWSAPAGATRFRPVCWLLEEDPQRRRLDENAPATEDLIAGYVRQVIANSQEL